MSVGLPDLPAAGDGSCLSLRRADKGDIDFLAATVVAANEERYRRRAGWSRDEFLAGLIADAADQVCGGPAGSTTYVIEAGEDRVGRLRLVDDGETLEVAGLQILPGRQGRGIGTAVLRSIMACADERHLLVVLDVEIDNPDAQRLYERLGFTVAGPADRDRLPMSRRPEPPTTPAVTS